VSAGGDYVSVVQPEASGLWSSSAPVLGRFDIELTERCDNDCIHCCICRPRDDAAASSRELTTADLKAVLTDVASLGAMTVRLTGGEPLLREDFEELYLHARRAGLKILLFTNARRVTPRLADLLARVPPLEPIEVTAYGMHAASSEKVTRRSDSLRESRRGISLLLERGVPVVLKGVVLPQTRDELDEFEEWGGEFPALTGPPPSTAILDLRVRRDSEARNEQIRALRAAPVDVVRHFRRRGDAYRDEMRRFCARFIGPPGDVLFACGAGHSPCLDSYGVLRPCLPLAHPETVVDLCARDGGDDTSGTLEPKRLREAMNLTFAALRERRATDPEYLRRCARCFLKGLCEQCPAKSWSEHGTLDTPVEYLCSIAHEQARDLGLLAAGESAWEVSDWESRRERL
jgi:MoaA/NifB/PqqE/SkfB family radical SAM enzyme